MGPGLLLVGAGLFVMGGLSGASSWTHLAMQRNLSHAGPLPVPTARLVTAIRQGRTGQLLASPRPAGGPAPHYAPVSRPASTTC